MQALRTRYDMQNGQYSSRCHQTAQRLVYPSLFGVDASAITWTDCDLQGYGTAENKRLDGEKGIDKIAAVQYPDSRIPQSVTIQERFQRPTNAARRNITITEWNEASNTPSELYKIHAQWFVGGFFTEDACSVIELVACGVPTLLSAIGRRAVYWDIKRNDKGQTFLRVTIDELRRAHLVALHIQDNEVVFDSLSDPYEGESEDMEDNIPPAFSLPEIIYREDPKAFWKEWGAR